MTLEQIDAAIAAQQRRLVEPSVVTLSKQQIDKLRESIELKLEPLIIKRRALLRAESDRKGEA